MATVKVIGAGLAGAEAAWQLAQRGISVELMEMKPEKKSPLSASAACDFRRSWDASIWLRRSAR